MSQRSKFSIHYQRHPGQAEVMLGIRNSIADIIVIDAARGWGKTIFVTCDIVLPELLKGPHRQVLWVAPSYKICKAPIDDVWKGIDEKTGKRFIPQIDDNTGFKFWDWKASEMELHIFNQSVLYCRSADNPDSIVGKGYDLIIVDEAALIGKDVFFQQILACARKAGCKIVLISTPRGRNWFYEMYLDGQDLSKPEYISFKQPWWKRPNYPEVLRRLMKNMPEHLRLQEFEAEFLADGSGAFKNLMSIFEGQQISFESDQQEWQAELTRAEMDREPFVEAVDFAKSSDYTVITVMGIESKRLVYYRRMNKTDYKVVLEIMQRIAQQYDADIIFDNTGVGSGLADFMNRKVNAFPFTFTNESKNELVNRLIVACEYGEIRIPNIATIRQEFELFSYQLTKTGKLSYGAPSGKHDDCVFSIAMAHWYASEQGGKAEVEELEDFLSTMNAIRGPKTELEQLMEEDD